MADLNGPFIVRPSETRFYVKPGVHSHNVRRQRRDASGFYAVLRHLRTVLLIIGLCGVGYYGYTVCDQYVYQAYQNWAFDQQIAGRRGVTFSDYVREQTPFGFLVGRKSAQPTESRPAADGPLKEAELAPPAQGSLLGRVAIPRLSLAAMVREGVDAKTLRIAVGHVPSTALPGQTGNFAIAAHRDTLFRALKDIQKGDSVTFQSSAGTYTYRVLATRIVTPSDVSVLRPDGGGLISASETNGQEPSKLLTMVTCYPFYYVGSAPKRFIVQAKLISDDPEARFTGPDTQDAELSAVAPTSAFGVQSKAPRQHRLSHAVASKTHRDPDTQPAPNVAKKRGFWHRVFHIS